MAHAREEREDAPHALAEVLKELGRGTLFSRRRRARQRDRTIREAPKHEEGGQRPAQVVDKALEDEGGDDPLALSLRATTKRAVARHSAGCDMGSGESTSSGDRRVEHAKSCLCCMPRGTCCKRASSSVREWRPGVGLAARESRRRAARWALGVGGPEEGMNGGVWRRRRARTSARSDAVVTWVPMTASSGVRGPPFGLASVETGRVRRGMIRYLVWHLNPVIQQFTARPATNVPAASPSVISALANAVGHEP
ncbi:hypothetical protein C8J57DRAFT_1212136 [Mycena rebaudengoi]|nr:hypothetical protein C8J57DRAFT_1212136 [Mycena rebaudengoi]